MVSNMSKPDSPKITKEQMSAYQRWEMASFDSELPSEREVREKKQAEENAQTVQTILRQVKQDAYEDGFKAGYLDGMAAAETRLGEDKACLIEMAAQFSAALQMQDNQLAESVLALSVDLAKAMLKTELQINPQVIIPVVLDAMHYLPQVKQPARLILHHEDAIVVRLHLGEELRQQGWQVLEDASIERGGCLVETAENQIDASNAMRWQRLTQGLARVDDWRIPTLSEHSGTPTQNQQQADS